MPEPATVETIDPRTDLRIRPACAQRKLDKRPRLPPEVERRCKHRPQCGLTVPAFPHTTKAGEEPELAFDLADEGREQPALRPEMAVDRRHRYPGQLRYLIDLELVSVRHECPSRRDDAPRCVAGLLCAGTLLVGAGHRRSSTLALDFSLPSVNISLSFRL